MYNDIGAALPSCSTASEVRGREDNKTLLASAMTSFENTGATTSSNIPSTPAPPPTGRIKRVRMATSPADFDDKDTMQKVNTLFAAGANGEEIYAAIEYRWASSRKMRLPKIKLLPERMDNINSQGFRQLIIFLGEVWHSPQNYTDIDYELVNRIICKINAMDFESKEIGFHRPMNLEIHSSFLNYREDKQAQLPDFLSLVAVYYAMVNKDETFTPLKPALMKQFIKRTLHELEAAEALIKSRHYRDVYRAFNQLIETLILVRRSMVVNGVGQTVDDVKQLMLKLTACYNALLARFPDAKSAVLITPTQQNDFISHLTGNRSSAPESIDIPLLTATHFVYLENQGCSENDVANFREMDRYIKQYFGVNK